MKKKILAISMAMAMAIGTFAFSACDIVNTDSEKDMAQAVAEVDISKSEDFSAGGDFAEYKNVVRPMSVSKRELVAYFVSTGYSYISQGETYTKTFEKLLDSIVNYKIVIQYATAFFFKNMNDVYTTQDYDHAVSGKSGEELSLAALRFFLDNENDEDNRLYYYNENGVKTYYTDEQGHYYTRFDKAVYALKQSINSALDTQEDKYLVSETDSSSSEEDRATPNDANTQKSEYFDAAYEIYTGLNNSAECGSYEKKDGSRKESRTKAYNSFLKMLSSNYLISEAELSTAARGELETLDYYRSELITQLESEFSSKLNDYYETEARGQITGKYLAERYAKLVEDQKVSYDKDVSSFESALGNLSDSSFVLYAPDGVDALDSTRYGFVYNVLLPFSTEQNDRLTSYNEDDGLTKAQKYQKRKELLEGIQATDQRDSWFNGTQDYSFVAKSGTPFYDNGQHGADSYLFFEDSITKSSGENAQYDKISKYLGQYPYNGTVSYDAKKGEYKLTANKLSITDFMTEMESYINYALGANRASGLNGSLVYNNDTFQLTAGKVGEYMQKDILTAEGEVDYSNFLYYVGKVSGLNNNANELFKDGTDNYTVMSAVNELQYAYSTDPGCLNTYAGYTSTKYKSSYVGEFEYAAKVAISEGVGTYTVCPSDYGWHVLYCVYAFDKGEVYTIAWTVSDTAVVNEDALTKGTFEYYFYNAVKSSVVSQYAMTLESKKTNLYNTDTCVKVYENRYSDYTVLDKSNSNTSTSK